MLTLLLLALAARGAAADKLALHAFMGGGGARAAGGAAPPPAALLLTRTGGAAATNATSAWHWYALADAPWADRKDLSFALWGAGTYAAYAWGSAPWYIASYSCQGPFIMEKLLALGGPAERAVAAVWMLTMPVSPVGKVWEAQNAEWHVATQGTWEASAEAILSARMLAAHGEGALLTAAPERLVCTSADGGASWALGGSGVAQPGLDDSACAAAPRALAGTPPGAQPPAPAPLLYADAPSIAFDGPAAHLQNSGRLLTQALRLAHPVTHLALPLFAKARAPARPWAANLTVFDAATRALVLAVELTVDPASQAWSALPAALQPGLYVLALALSDAPPPGAPKASDSWFLGVAWVSNGRPAAPGGGAGQGTYGRSPHWQRSASASGGALLSSTTPSAYAAGVLEAARVARAAAAAPPAALGRSLGDYAALALAYNLALASQVPTAAPGHYDVLVIPEPLFRGSLEDGVDSGCSYYDLLRIGFASSYINLRLLEALEAYGELQAAGLVGGGGARGCSADTAAFGSDSARLLSATAGDATPCYTAAQVAALAAGLRAAIGNRFSDSATGAFADWLGCAAMGANGGNVSACGLQAVAGGAVPPGSPLNAVRTGFLPTAALAARLGVPAGGTNVSATLAQFERLRLAAGREDLADACGGASSSSSGSAESSSSSAAPAFYGGGYFHTNVCPLESVDGGANSTIAGGPNWALRDAQGYAVRSERNTGDWHMFAPGSVAAGGSRGYGQWAAQGENGGRFFTTAAFVWDALSSPYSGGGNASQPPPPRPYPAMAAEWSRLVEGLTAIGSALGGSGAPIDPSVPLAPGDAGMLSAPVADPLVFQLCAAVRAKFNFPNVTDAWGQRLCNYYQDLGWGTPENGVALFSFLKGLTGLHVRAVSVPLSLNPPPSPHTHTCALDQYRARYI